MTDSITNIPAGDPPVRCSKCGVANPGVGHTCGFYSGTNGTTTLTGGTYCSLCGQWYIGTFHTCSPYTHYFTPDNTYLLLPILERIAIALEKIAKEKDDKL